MYIQLRKDICVGISELPINESAFQPDERQIKFEDADNIDSLQAFLGKMYVDGEFIDPPKSKEQLAFEEMAGYRNFLLSTDWKVTRHRDQVSMGIDTSLSEEEFQQLLKERQNARDQMVMPGEEPT